jgi:hypothetical protein
MCVCMYLNIYISTCIFTYNFFYIYIGSNMNGYGGDFETDEEDMYICTDL